MMVSRTTNPTKILTEVYNLAATATSKLQFEASQQDHCLRRMVLTANLIDDLTDEIYTLELHMAKSTAGRHTGVRWTERVAKDLEALELLNDDAGHDDSSSSDEEDEALTPPTTPMKEYNAIGFDKSARDLSPPSVHVHHAAEDLNADVDDGDADGIFHVEDVAALALTRTRSHQRDGKPLCKGPCGVVVEVQEVVESLDPLPLEKSKGISAKG